MQNDILPQDNFEALDKKPKVSVCVVTYNQEKYIRQCLQSIVDQETDFDFEVIVADDCSTDGTQNIIKEFEKKYPHKILSIFNKINIGAYKNYSLVHSYATGEYICHIDGDDYCLAGKIQAQVNILDSDASISLSGHAVKIHDSDQIIGADSNLPVYGSLKDLLRLGTYFVNSSMMYRSKNKTIQHIKEDFVDFFIFIEQAAKGKIHLNKIPLGVYRQSPTGISKLPEHRRKIERAYESAFNRALILGAEPSIVEHARMDRRMKIAITRYLSGDIEGYKSLIRLKREERQYATYKHKVLNYLYFFPSITKVYLFIKSVVK